jgi:transposase
MCVGRQSPSVDGEQPELFAGITHHFRVEVWLPNRHGHGVGQVQRQKRRTASRLRYRARQNRPRESARDSRHPSSRTSHHRLSRASVQRQECQQAHFHTSHGEIRHPDHDADDDTVSLTTTESRVRCDLALPDADDGYQRQSLDLDTWSVTESTRPRRRRLFYIGFRRHKNDTERNTAKDGTVLGVDLGIENLAVTSAADFFSGQELTHDLREFEKVRAGLQQTGTRSAHRTLRQSSGRELRSVRDVLHRASNAIVDEALRYECDVIAFEDLTHIRDRTGASWGTSVPNAVRARGVHSRSGRYLGEWVRRTRRSGVASAASQRTRTARLAPTSDV